MSSQVQEEHLKEQNDMKSLHIKEVSQEKQEIAWSLLLDITLIILLKIHLNDEENAYIWCCF